MGKSGVEGDGVCRNEVHFDLPFYTGVFLENREISVLNEVN